MEGGTEEEEGPAGLSERTHEQLSAAAQLSCMSTHTHKIAAPADMSMELNLVTKTSCQPPEAGTPADPWVTPLSGSFPPIDFLQHFQQSCKTSPIPCASCSSEVQRGKERKGLSAVCLKAEPEKRKKQQQLTLFTLKELASPWLRMHSLMQAGMAPRVTSS